MWDRADGRPVGNAIVWQDRRTAPLCAELKAAGHEPARARADRAWCSIPYFSATKIAGCSTTSPGLRARAEARRARVRHRRQLPDLAAHGRRGARHRRHQRVAHAALRHPRARVGSDELCALFGVPPSLLPEVCPSAGRLGETARRARPARRHPDHRHRGRSAGGAVRPGLHRAGRREVHLRHGRVPADEHRRRAGSSTRGLLTTVAWTLDIDAARTTSYALEGSAFIAGALVQWLRDGLGIIAQAADIEALARSVPDSGGVTIVPALAGLGAPHWRPEARGLITGLTRGTTKAHIARAALEAIALQNVDLADGDAGGRRACRSTDLRVDGGAAANDLLMQFQADLLGVQIFRPEMVESTALGAAKLAALGVGLPPVEKGGETARMRMFTPTMPAGAARRDAGALGRGGRTRLRRGSRDSAVRASPAKRRAKAAKSG